MNPVYSKADEHAMIRAKTTFQQAILLLGDLIVFECALFLTLAIRYGRIEWSTFMVHVEPFTVLALTWVIAFYVVGLYDLRTVRQPSKLFRTYLEGMFANFALAVAFFYLIPNLGIEPRTNLFIHFSLSLLFGYIWRLTFSKTVLAFDHPDNVLFIGPLPEAEQIKRLLTGSGLNLALTSIITSPEFLHLHHDPTWMVSTDPDQLTNIIDSQSIRVIVTSAALEQSPLTKTLYQTLFLPVQLMDRTELEELTTNRIPLDHVSEVWFLQNFHEADKGIYEAIKRAADIVLAIPFGLLTLVILPFVALIIKLSSPGPIFIRQTRVGLGGKNFTLLKFRSMHVQSADGLSEPNGPQFTTDAKTDPRLFPSGRIMRQLRIDELPQLWNVLRGDLSLIGPRPERPEFVEPLIAKNPYYALRHLTRPGVTGWAQVIYLKPNTSIDDNLIKLQYDLYYIKHRSLLLDASILLKTIGIVLRRQGT